VLGDRRYWVEARLFVDGEAVDWFPTGRLLLGRMHVVDREHVYSAPPGIRRVGAEFGDLALLLGYTVEPDGLRPGAPVAVTLYWQAQAEHDTSYKVFVHLVGPDGAIAAQDDAIPAGGALPTNLWVTGEVIADRHPLVAPDSLVPGRYSLRVGLYDPVSGERLEVVGGPAFDRALELQSFDRP